AALAVLAGADGAAGRDSRGRAALAAGHPPCPGRRAARPAGARPAARADDLAGSPLPAPRRFPAELHAHEAAVDRLASGQQPPPPPAVDGRCSARHLREPPMIPQRSSSRQLAVSSRQWAILVFTASCLLPTAYCQEPRPIQRVELPPER